MTLICDAETKEREAANDAQPQIEEAWMTRPTFRLRNIELNDTDRRPPTPCESLSEGGTW